MKIWKKGGMDKTGSLSLLVVIGVIMAGLSAPLLAPHDPLAVQMSLRYAGPSWEYLLGNDQLGRCILSRLIYAIRPSVLAVLIVLLLSVLIGAVLGFAAGYFRGRIDTWIMRICDVVLSFPGYVMTLAIVGILGVGLENILIAFVLTKWAWFARVIRTSVLQYTEQDYIRFARATGMGHGQIIRRHVIPVTFADIAVVASSSIGAMILQISGFSFLGLGIQAPQAEWGMMLNEAREVMFTRPEMMLPPGIAIVIVVSAFHFLADSLQVALDPRLRQSKVQHDRQPEHKEVPVRL
ncbi:staphylopine uptake ABC transporter permease subunit CntC [Paenibacillus sp. Z6-24]